MDKNNKRSRFKTISLVVGSFSIAFVAFTLYLYPIITSKDEDVVIVDDAVKTQLNIGNPFINPEPYILENISAPSNSFGFSSGNVKLVNWSFFWSFFENYSGWNLEYTSKLGNPWVNYTQYIEFDNIRLDGYEKQIINFTAPDTGYYRLNHTINCFVNDYVFNATEHEYTLNVSIPGSNETYFVFFNWSDLIHSSWNDYLIYSHGLDSNNSFYLQLDITSKIVKNSFISLDPTFGNTGTGGNYMNIVSEGFRGTLFSNTANGTITSISMYVLVEGGYKGFAGMGYYLDGGELLGYTDADETPVTGWYTKDIVSGGTISNGDSYYLVGWGDIYLAKILSLGYSATGSTDLFIVGETFPTWPEGIEPVGDEDYTYCIYATYTDTDPEIQSGTETPTNGSTNVNFSDTNRIWHRDAQETTLDIDFLSNSSGSWVSYYFIDDASTVYPSYTMASSGTVANNSNWSDYNTKYYWRVKLTDPEGHYITSPIYNFTTTMMIPEIRDNYPVNGSTGISLTPIVNITVWDNSTDAESLTVKWYENTSGVSESGSIGDDTTSGSGITTIEDQIIFGRCTTPSGITNLTSITVLVSGDIDDSYLIKGVVYDWTSPFTLLPNGVTEEKNIVLTGSDQWVTLNFTTPPEPNASEDILIGVACNVSSVANINFRYDATGIYNTYFETITYPTIPPSISSLNNIDTTSIPHIYVNYTYFNPDGFLLQQTNNSVTNGSSVEWVYTNASEYNTQYWWKVEVNNSQKTNSSWYSFTTIDSGISNQYLFDGWFSGGNITNNNQLISGWFAGNNISNNQQLITGYFSGGNLTENQNLISGYFSGGNITTNIQILTGWFSGGNNSILGQLISGWFSGNNVSSLNQLISGYFSGGNISILNQLVSGWFSGGNISVSTNQYLFDGWFSGGNLSVNNQLVSGWFRGGNVTDNVQIISGWFSGNNVSSNQYLLSGWFSGGNLSILDQITSGWFSGGNVTANQQLISGWFSGGNETLSVNQQVFTGWFSGGNLSVNSQLISGWFRGGNISNNEYLLSGWFSGGNNSLLSEIIAGWFSGGNETPSENQQVFSGWFSGGNNSFNQFLLSGFFSGGNISDNEYLLSGWFSGGNISVLDQLVSGWFSGGNETTTSNQYLLDGWFRGGNVTDNVQIISGWFSGGNLSINTQTLSGFFTGGNISQIGSISSGWFSGGNNSLLSEIIVGWFSGGNETTVSNQYLFDGWFSGGNITNNNQLISGWFAGNNISNNQQLITGYFSGGNQSQINSLLSGWFSGGQDDVSQLISGWFSGGNDTGYLQQLLSGWFSGGNVSWLNISITNEFPIDLSFNAPLQPTVYATVSSLNGSIMNMSIFYGSQGSENILLTTHNNVSNGTYSSGFFQASNRSETYYWRVMADDGTNWVNETFSFTTEGYAGGTGYIVPSGGVAGYIGLFGIISFIIVLLFILKRRKKEDMEG